MQSAIWTQQRRSCGTALPKAKLAYLGIRGKYIHGWLFARYAATCSRNFYTAMIPNLSPSPDPSFACHTTFMAAWCSRIRHRSCPELPLLSNFRFPVRSSCHVEKDWRTSLSTTLFRPRFHIQLAILGNIPVDPGFKAPARVVAFLWNYGNKRYRFK